MGTFAYNLIGALVARDVEAIRIAGSDFLRNLIDDEYLEPEEAWRRFDNFCELYIPRDLMTQARQRIAARNIPRGTYDTETAAVAAANATRCA